MTTSFPQCPACGVTAVRVGSVPGYVDGTQYEVFNCARCKSALAWPQIASENIYNRIYESGPRVPGYDRYWSYAQLVEASRTPLATLSEQEECYWAAGQVVRSMPAGSRILEVGCGLGYLTFALHGSGYAAHGIDLSDVTIRNATQRFGPLFETADLFAYAADHAGCCDLVILTEVIEHVTEPLLFLRAALRLLRPNGRVFVTTPNKSAYDEAVLWDCDLPPVHWWWFTEEFFRQFCAASGCQASFIDFTPFHRAGFGCLLPPVVRPAMVEKRGPIFSADGALIGHQQKPAHPVVAALKRTRPIRKVIRRLRLLGRPRGRACDSGTMAVVFAP